MSPKNIHKISITPKIFLFLKTPKNIEIQNFEPKKITWAYVAWKYQSTPLGAPHLVHSVTHCPKRQICQFQCTQHVQGIEKMFHVLLYTTLKADLKCWNFNIDIFPDCQHSKECNHAPKMSRVGYLALVTGSLWLISYELRLSHMGSDLGQRANIGITRSFMHWYVGKNFLEN